MAETSVAITAGSGTPIDVFNSGTGSALRQAVVIADSATTGNVAKITNDGGMQIAGTQAAVSTASWTSATSVNTANTISVTGYNTVSVAVVATTTFTGGVITFEVSPDNTNWFPIAMARIDSYNVESVYTIVASTNRAWSTSVDGFTNFRVRLSTAITGTGTLSVLVTPQTMPIEPIVAVGQATASQLQATVTTNVEGTGNTTAPTKAIQIGASDGTNIQAFQTGSGDGKSNWLVLETGDAHLNSASNWDRTRAASFAAGTTGTGIPASGTLGFDGTNYQRLKTTTAGALVNGSSTTGGLTPFTLISAATTNATSVKASAGTVYGIQASNTGAAAAFLKIYNKASAPTVGTDTAVKTLIIPAGGGIVVPINDIGIALGTGIAIAITGVATTADTTAVALAQVVVNIDYA